MTVPIRVLVVDDHPIVREGLRALVDAKPELELAGEAADGDEAIAQARSLRPDVILLDLLMPRKDGIEAIGEIKRDNPDARILVLTSYAEDEKILSAIKAGAAGYLLKDSSPDDLLAAIREVHLGRASLHPAVAHTVLRDIRRSQTAAEPEKVLTEREIEVLKLLAGGMDNRAIACALGISERTVTTHASNIMSKLNVENRVQATLYALREGLVSLDSGVDLP